MRKLLLCIFILILSTHTFSRPVLAENRFRYRVINDDTVTYIDNQRKILHQAQITDEVFSNKEITEDGASQGLEYSPPSRSSIPLDSKADNKASLEYQYKYEVKYDIPPQEQKIELAAPKPTHKDFMISDMLHSVEYLKEPVFENNFTFYDFLKEKLHTLGDENFEFQLATTKERIVQMHQIFQVADWRIKNYYQDIIKKQSSVWGVPPHIIKAIIIQESQGQNYVESHKGAKGLMQLMDGTANLFETTDSYDPEQNIKAGTRYIDWLLDLFENNTSFALAAYNAGQSRVQRYQGIPPFPETQNYVTRVMDYIEIYKKIEAIQTAAYEK